MEKKCGNCGVVKPDSCFHVRKASKDGLSARCKNCQKEYDRSRLLTPSRVEARKRYMAAHRTDGEWLAQRAKEKDEWRKRNREKQLAHNAVNYAIRSGRITRQTCSVCGAPNAEAHHDDYSKRLDVVWLCDAHHKQRHIEIRRESTMRKHGMEGG